MPANNPLSSLFTRTARNKKPVYILSVLTIVALAAWAKGAFRTTASPAATESAVTPALKLAAGTLKLEGTDQAIDAASAARLLPLWQLLDQLQGSSATAPQEIGAVIDEIQVNMTAAQLTAINAMSITQAQLGSTSANSAKASSTQTANAASGAVPGLGMFSGGGPMDGGPMPGSGPRSGSSSGSSDSSSASASPSLIEQVIQLLEKKAQG